MNFSDPQKFHVTEKTEMKTSDEINFQDDNNANYKREYKNQYF